MALKKTEKADIKRRYPLYVEIGMVLTLAVLIVAFRLDMSADAPPEFALDEQEVVQMEEIQQTQQIEKPPPPPRPPVPVEVPNDEVLDDVDLDLDVSLDLDDMIDLPPPPPPAEEEEEEPEIFVIVEQSPELIENETVRRFSRN
ncbi:MAG: energy transducer TonB, partial [Rhodothermales bacterium]